MENMMNQIRLLNLDFPLAALLIPEMEVSAPKFLKVFATTLHGAIVLHYNALNYGYYYGVLLTLLQTIFDHIARSIQFCDLFLNTYCVNVVVSDNAQENPRKIHTDKYIFKKIIKVSY